MRGEVSHHRALEIIGSAERNGSALTFDALRERLGYTSRGAAINLAHKLRDAGLIAIDKRVRPALLKLSESGRDVA